MSPKTKICENTYTVGYNRTHLKKEAEPVAETWYLYFLIVNNRPSPGKRKNECNASSLEPFKLELQNIPQTYLIFSTTTFQTVILNCWDAGVWKCSVMEAQTPLDKFKVHRLA